MFLTAMISAPSQCTFAHEDPLHRTLCCIQADAEEIDEMLGIINRYTSPPPTTTTTLSPMIIDGEAGVSETSREVVNSRPVKVLTSSGKKLYQYINCIDKFKFQTPSVHL